MTNNVTPNTVTPTTDTSEAVIYVRVAKDPAGSGLGVQRQEQACRDLAEQRGMNVRRVYADNDISAYPGKARPGYQMMLSELNSADVPGAVIVFDLARLTRREDEVDELFDLLDRRGIALRTVMTGAFGPSSDRLVARVMAALGATDSEIRSERAKAAAAHRKATRES